MIPVQKEALSPPTQRLARCLAELDFSSDSEADGPLGFLRSSSLSRRRQPDRQRSGVRRRRPSAHSVQRAAATPGRCAAAAEAKSEPLRQRDDADGEDASDVTTDVSSDCGEGGSAGSSSNSVCSEGGSEGASAKRSSPSLRRGGPQPTRPVAWISLGSRLAGAVRNLDESDESSDEDFFRHRSTAPTYERVEVAAWQSVGQRLFKSVALADSDSEGDSNISDWRPKHHKGSNGRPQTPPTRVTSPLS
eukprot:TRINITY_DN11335_c0_g1_i2.p1 TRINITY_DN11335_c0_g1~~TRINITY_DN11335_c0_g1_i2.p1  ORF type:complete len:248 (-),score=39.05 TRINITY_DN11335_c0_g1_i2:254-997(-)